MRVPNNSLLMLVLQISKYVIGTEGTAFQPLNLFAAVIYTTTDWWTTCTGNSASFASTNPLWVARYASSVGTLPAGWSYETFWQSADSGANPGDQDIFNGDMAGLQRLVKL